MKKIAEVHPYGKPVMAVYYFPEKQGNRYGVYKEWTEYFDPKEYGMIRSAKHKRLVARYANLYSCMAVMAEYIRNNDEEKRGDE